MSQNLGSSLLPLLAECESWGVAVTAPGAGSTQVGDMGCKPDPAWCLESLGSKLAGESCGGASLLIIS